MEIVNVVELDQFQEFAVEITDEPDVEFLDGLMKKYYGPGYYADKRDEQRIGPGYIDLVYGDDWPYTKESIRPGQKGWVFFKENTVEFYPHEIGWLYYRRGSNESSREKETT